MATATQQLTELAGQWRDARRLYLLYGALQQKFDLGVPPCPELESPINRAEPEALVRVWAWFAQMDERVHVHQLRQLLQTTRLGTEENLRAIITRHLDKENKVDADRDKVDFLLVQYLGSCAPPGFYDKEVTFEDCAMALEPVLGEVGIHTPKWLEPLDECLKEIEQCQSIRELLGKGILDETRLLKVSSGEMYFGPTALVAITRFNFLARRGFVRMIAADLHAIRSTLRDLEVNGIATIDCSKAGLSNQETLNHLRDICHEWKKAFHAAYAAGQSFKQLVDVRTIVEDRLNQAIAEKLQREEQEKARAEAELRARLEAEERARQEAEETARREAEEKARLGAEAEAKREAEQRARQKAEEKTRKEAEEAARQQAEREWLEAEAKAKREKEEAEAKAKRTKEEAEHLDEYERAIREAEEKEKRDAEKKARLAHEAEEQVKREAEEKARLEEEERKRKEKEEYEKEFARLEAEENARKEVELKAAKEVEERARKAAEASRPKTAEELELEAYEAAIKAAEPLAHPLL
jgi:DNA segregation ATPase FtsK/SpoIIIE-like protein